MKKFPKIKVGDWVQLEMEGGHKFYERVTAADSKYFTVYLTDFSIKDGSQSGNLPWKFVKKLSEEENKTRYMNYLKEEIITCVKMIDDMDRIVKIYNAI